MLRKHTKKLIAKRKSILKYLTAAILLVVPLYPKFPFINIPGTFVSVRLEDFILAISAIYLLILVISRLPQFINDNLNKAILLYIVIGLVSLMSAVFITKTAPFHIGLLHWFRRIEYFIPFFVALYSIKASDEAFKFYLKLLMIVVMIAFVFGFGQKYFNLPIIVTQNEEYSRGIALRYVSGGHINSTFAGHYDLGTFLVLSLPIFINVFFMVKKKLTKIIVFTVLLSGLWLLAHSGSRISVVSYLIAASIGLILIKKWKEIVLVLIVSVLMFSTSESLVSRYSRIFRVTIEKLSSITEKEKMSIARAQEINDLGPSRRQVLTPTPTPVPVFEDRSTSIRLNVEWPRAIRALKKNPLLGTGYSSITLATDNDYLRLLGETGIIGFMSFILILTVIGKKLLQRMPFEKNFKGIKLALIAGYVGGTIGILINAVFIDVFEASKFAISFWLMTGIAVQLVNKRSYE